MPTMQNPTIINSGTILSAPSVGATGWPPSWGDSPVGAYGSMPSPPSMFLQPTILSPGMPNNFGMPTMDFPQGMAQPFTQFVNGMPVQQTMPSTNTSVSDHPCQGKGGSGCGCGGNCTDNKTNLNQQNLTQPITSGNIPSPEEIEKLKSLIDPKVYQEQVLKTIPGNTSLMTATMPNGEYITSIAKVMPNRNIILQVTEVTKNEIIIDVEYAAIDNDQGWKILNSNGRLHKDQIIPNEYSLDSFALTGIAVAISSKLIAAKIDNINAQNTSKIKNPCEGLTNQPMCREHDMVCSPLIGQWPWTSDKLHVQFWAPCIGSFDTYIGDCCKGHDSALWCSHNFWEYEQAALAVIGCVVSAVIKRALEVLHQQLDQMGWFERLFAGPICTLIVAAWTWAISILLAIDLFVIYTGAYLFLLLSKSHLINTDHSHDDSCLCGGTKPTILCFGDPCRDLCKEFGEASKREQCFHCKWDESNGPNGFKLLDPGPLKPDGTPKLPCCPGDSCNCRFEDFFR